MMSRWCLVLLLCLPVSGWATVPSLVTIVAEKEGVPADVLWAIVNAESRSLSQAGARPWPWVLNVDGRGLFFPTQSAAARYAEGLLATGQTRWDIGLGQVNWHWHAARFNDDPWLALTPRINLSVSARILREQYQRSVCRGWYGAIGCYHRPARRPQDLVIANRYAERVLGYLSVTTHDF